MPTKLLTGWDAGVALYLVLVYWLIATTRSNEIRRRAAIQDEGAFALLLLTGAAAIASLVAIVAELGQARERRRRWHELAVGMGTIVLSWLFMHTIFALALRARILWRAQRRQIGGLKFPGTQAPDYWDFLYFSLVVAMTCQVSDVAVTSKVIRRVVTVHGVAVVLLQSRDPGADHQHDLQPGANRADAMTATMETLLFMMAVLAAVAVAAKRLNIAPSILLVVAGIGMALIPGLPKVDAGAGSRAAGVAAAADLFGRRRHELARFPLQPAADRRCSPSAAWCSPPARWRRPRIIC